MTRQRNKLVELRHLIESYEVSFIAITETWLTEAVKDSELLPSNFHIHRKDRSCTQTSTRGGGVLLAVDSNIVTRRRADLEPHLEVLVCEIIFKSRPKMAVVLWYRPPNDDRSDFNSQLDETLHRVFSQFTDVCLLGDFNMPGIDWSLPVVPTPSSTSLVDFIQTTKSHGLSQINTFPSNTITSSFLDLIFISDIHLLSALTPLDDEVSFDELHRILYFELSATREQHMSVERTVFNYKRADVNALNNAVSDIAIDNDIHNVSEIWTDWKRQVDAAVSSCVPKITLRSRTDPPWFDGEARHLVKKKRTLWKQAKRKDTHHARERYRMFSNHVKNALRTKHDNFIDSLGDLCSQNPKRFWSFLSSKTKSKSIPTCISDGTELCHTAQDKAVLFNSFFCSVFTGNQPCN